MKNILYVVWVIAAMSLALTVSCSKKEEERKVESRVQAVELLPEIPEAAPPDARAEVQAEVKTEVQIEVEETPVEVSAPAPKPARAAPAPKPARAAPRIFVESISGPRQAGVGQEITLTAAIRGDESPTGYFWRAKIGGETLVEQAASEPRVKMRLEKAGEAHITCEARRDGAVLASQTVRLNIVAAAPRQTAPAADAAADPKLVIEYIYGPKQAYAGQELTLKCSVVGVGSIAGYVWRFQNGGDTVEKKTSEPQVKVALDKVGTYAITCDVVDAGGAVATQHFNIRIVSGLLSVNAGGPYSAMMNKPAKLLGNAASNTGKIALYEWFFGGEKPEWSGAENAVVQHVFTKSGDFRAAFRVTLADGTSVSDTAIVYVESMKPIANAGQDVVSYPNRKVKLKGSGRSPDGSIVKYEWDFDGDGTFDWSSAKNGETTYPFKTYSYPVFRVTDTEGNTAVDTARVVICPGGMVTVERGKFCADKYEWPNKRGSMPVANISWEEASNACHGAGKRLCTSDEWQRACRNDNSQNEAGPNVFPYGSEFNDEGCNTLGNPKTQNKLNPSGSLGACTGAGGAFDMSGNAAEWAAAPDGSARAHGGFYQSGPDASNCDSYVTLEHNRKYLYVGFRCCK